MNIRIYLYPRNDTNEYPNIFVSKRWYERISEYIRIKKAIRMNIRIYSYQKNDTNMMRTNIHIGKYSNVRIHSYQIFDISFRFDARCWIFDVWYNRKLKHSWHNKMEVIFLWTLIFVWTIWAIYLLDLLAQTLDFSLEYIRIKKRYERISEYIRIKKMIRTNIRIYSYQKNNTNEYPNIFASKKWYEYDTNEYSYRKIFEYIRISEYSPHPGSKLPEGFRNPTDRNIPLILLTIC